MLKSNYITDLFYWKWRVAFNKAVAPCEVYKSRRLFEKLNEVLFFEKLEAEGLPSYNYWSYVYLTLSTNLPIQISEVTYENEGSAFKSSDVDYLKKRFHDVLRCFTYFPQILIDLYRFYPRFNLKFQEIEFSYLDFWSEIPKVINSLFEELAARGIPPLEAIPKGGFVDPFFEEPWVYPPKKVDEDTFKNLIIYYFLGFSRDPIFQNILMEYLKVRPLILEECTKGLLRQNLEVTDKFLAQELIYNYMFTDAHLHTTWFCNENLSWSEDSVTGEILQDPFRRQREKYRRQWEGFTEVERQTCLENEQKRLEEVTEIRAKEAAKTHEQKLAEYKAFQEENAKAYAAFLKWKEENKA